MGSQDSLMDGLIMKLSSLDAKAEATSERGYITEVRIVQTPLEGAFNNDMNWCNGIPCMDNSRYLFTFRDSHMKVQFVVPGDVIVKYHNGTFDLFPQSDEPRPEPFSVIIEDTVHVAARPNDKENPPRNTLEMLSGKSSSAAEITTILLQNITIEILELLAYARPKLETALKTYQGISDDIVTYLDHESVGNAHMLLCNAMAALSGLVSDPKFQGMKSMQIPWQDVLDSYLASRIEVPPETEIYL
jgi:hypothetical protein